MKELAYKTTNQGSYWDIKLSIAKSIANDPNPSTQKLQQDIIEEFGYPPEPELIDFFLKLTSRKIQGKKDQSENEKRRLAETMAQESAPSVLKFRREFHRKYALNPPNELTSYFLQKLQDYAKTRQLKEQKQGQLDFTRTKAQESSCTILQFRAAFQETFGEEPSNELLAFFLKNMARVNKTPPATSEKQTD